MHILFDSEFRFNCFLVFDITFACIWLELHCICKRIMSVCIVCSSDNVFVWLWKCIKRICMHSFHGKEVDIQCSQIHTHKTHGHSSLMPFNLLNVNKVQQITLVLMRMGCSHVLCRIIIFDVCFFGFLYSCNGYHCHLLLLPYLCLEQNVWKTDAKFSVYGFCIIHGNKSRN